MDTNQPVTPDPALANLVRWTDYWRSLANLFPTKASADWFIRTRKPVLADRGILVETVKGYLVRKDLLDASLLDLMKGVQQ